MSFSKLSSGIIDSSIWDEEDHVIRVWIAILAKKDENGYVDASYNGMKRIANIKHDEDGNKFDNAIKVLESPDYKSKTDDYEGRRIARVAGGWIVLNHEKYRLKENLIKEQTRERVRRHREKLKTDEKTDVTQCNVTSGEECNTTEIEPAWMENSETGYQSYIASVKEAVIALKNDWEWISYMKTRLPNTNIRESLQVSYDDFWGDKKGWEKKKEAYRSARKKAKKEKRLDNFSYELNWKRTFQSTLKYSRVPIPYGAADVEKLKIDTEKRSMIEEREKSARRVSTEEKMSPEDVRKAFKMPEKPKMKEAV